VVLVLERADLDVSPREFSIPKLDDAWIDLCAHYDDYDLLMSGFLDGLEFETRQYVYRKADIISMIFQNSDKGIRL
jgi:hypothetical protein